jgi:hypothetical protein
MTPKEKFETVKLDFELLKAHPNNHQRRKYIREVVTDELLLFLYLEEKLSANSIVQYLKTFGVNTGGAGFIIQRLQKDLKINTRSISDSCALEQVKILKAKSIKRKYGDDITNVSQSSVVKDLKRQKCLLVYGVDNNFKSPIIKKKIKDFWVTNYGVEHPSELPGFFKRRFRLSKPHRDVLLILDDLHITYEFETNKHFKAYNPILDRRFCPVADIYIPSKRLVVEVNGCYWHANPKIYKATDLFNTVAGKVEASQIWLKDKIKRDHILGLNFNFEVIWSDEVTKEKVTSIIENYEDY